MAIPFTRPKMRRRYMHSVLTQLVDEEVGPGKTTRDLVAGLCARLGMSGGVAFSSTHTAIAAAMEVLELSSGDRVVVPALAPAVYLDALRTRGLDPRLIDTDAEGNAISREALAAEIAAGARAVLAHSPPGLPMVTDSMPDTRVPVIEDVSATLTAAATAEDGLVPPGPALALVSLEAGSLLHAGCGALVLASRKGLLPGLKVAVGNASIHQQLPNMNAALALAQLDDLDRDGTRRREIALLYRAALRRSRHEPLGGADPGSGTVSCFPVRLKDGLPEARQYARKHGVETRVTFEDSCASRAPELAESCPNARRLLLCCLAFPLYPMLSRKEAESVCRVLATLP